MSSTETGRIKRGPPPRKPIKRYKHRQALPELTRDFGDRCAYSMLHVARAGGKFDVDHFDPRQKKDHIQKYENLFLASKHCNERKSARWPKPFEEKEGARFLNPCKEKDYDVQIFEDPGTHLLIGTTMAARWHIEACGLNAGFLVNERQLRAESWKALNSAVVGNKVDLPFSELQKVIESCRVLTEQMIPMILPPPPEWTTAVLG